MALADIGELLGKKLALSDTVHENKVDHAYIGVKDGFEQDAPLDALHRDLPGNLLNRNIVRNLDQKVRICLGDFVLMDSLRGERLLWALLTEESLAILVFHLDHVDDALEPVGEEDGILTAAGLAQVGLGESNPSSLLLDVLLEPLGLILVLVLDAGLG